MSRLAPAEDAFDCKFLILFWDKSTAVASTVAEVKDKIERKRAHMVRYGQKPKMRCRIDREDRAGRFMGQTEGPAL